MLTILIKGYCVNIVTDIKPIYLNKYHFLQNKIYYLDKIYFCFKISFSNILLKKRFWHRSFPLSFAKLLGIAFLKRTSGRLLLNKWLYHYSDCRQTVKSLISSCRRNGETILSNYWQNPKITATVHYFHYNSHHYHYYHFHYHCKMHLYHLKILLTMLFFIIWSCLF